MELLIAMLLATQGSAPPAKAVARAEVRIVRPHKASRESWVPAATRRQREITHKERDGTVLRLRLTEFE